MPRGRLRLFLGVFILYMFKIVLKHFIYEQCINAAFEKISHNFPKSQSSVEALKVMRDNPKIYGRFFSTINKKYSCWMTYDQFWRAVKKDRISIVLSYNWELNAEWSLTGATFD